MCWPPSDPAVGCWISNWGNATGAEGCLNIVFNFKLFHLSCLKLWAKQKIKCQFKHTSYQTLLTSNGFPIKSSLESRASWAAFSASSSSSSISESEVSNNSWVSQYGSDLNEGWVSKTLLVYIFYKVKIIQSNNFLWIFGGTWVDFNADTNVYFWFNVCLGYWRISGWHKSYSNLGLPQFG